MKDGKWKAKQSALGNQIQSYFVVSEKQCKLKAIVYLSR